MVVEKHTHSTINQKGMWLDSGKIKKLFHCKNESTLIPIAAIVKINKASLFNSEIVNKWVTKNTNAMGIKVLPKYTNPNHDRLKPIIFININSNPLYQSYT